MFVRIWIYYSGEFDDGRRSGIIGLHLDLSQYRHPVHRFVLDLGRFVVIDTKIYTIENVRTCPIHRCDGGIIRGLCVEFRCRYLTRSIQCLTDGIIMDIVVVGIGIAYYLVPTRLQSTKQHPNQFQRLNERQIETSKGC